MCLLHVISGPGYLTTNDVVENVAQVSTKFQQLSEDEILIAIFEEEEEEAEEEEEDVFYLAPTCFCGCTRCFR